MPVLSEVSQMIDLQLNFLTNGKQRHNLSFQRRSVRPDYPERRLRFECLEVTPMSPPRPIRTLYLCYFGLRQPLVQTQVLPYLRQLRAVGIEVSLITFEPNKRRMWSPEDVEEWRTRLQLDGIHWYFLPYHKRPSLPATVYDIAAGAWLACRLLRHNRIDVLHARSHVGAAIGALAKKWSGGSLIFDVRGFFPEEYVDAGRWPARGFLYRLTKSAERRLFAAADGFVVLTTQARSILFPGCLETDQLGRPVEIIPCCVDMDRFRAVDSLSKESIQEELGLAERRVLAYVGALGGWYLTQELAEFLAVAHRHDPTTFSMILTQSPPEMITVPLKRLGVAAKDYLIRQVSPNEVPLYLKAADAGLSFIKSCYSKLSSSPAKIAEYLASGIPVISNAGIGDLDSIIEGDRVGIILRDLRQEAYLQALHKLDELLRDSDVSNRCRTSARKRFDLQSIGASRYHRLYRRLVENHKPGVASS
jgi:glycosyltransferase involved in cell wall biosynthesis